MPSQHLKHNESQSACSYRESAGCGNGGKEWRFKTPFALMLGKGSPAAHPLAEEGRLSNGRPIKSGQFLRLRSSLSRLPTTHGADPHLPDVARLSEPSRSWITAFRCLRRSWPRDLLSLYSVSAHAVAVLNNERPCDPDKTIKNLTQLGGNGRSVACKKSQPPKELTLDGSV